MSALKLMKDAALLDGWYKHPDTDARKIAYNAACAELGKKPEVKETAAKPKKKGKK